MAIAHGASGSWAASNATTQTVTLPTHAAGDMLIVRAIRKPFTNPNDIVCNTSGWAEVGAGVANGSTANGVGVGSMAFKAFWKIATSAAETNPVVTWGTTSAPGAAVAIVYTKGSTEYWVTPVGDGGGDATARTAQTSTIASHVSVTAGDMVDFFRGQCDDSGALTVPTITQTGVTYGTVSEQPAAALSSATSNDIAADGGYRLASSGTSSAAAVVTGTSAASEQHGAWMTRLRVTTTATLTIPLLDASPALYAPTLVQPWTTDNAYEAAISADAPTVVFSMEEASGNLSDLVSGKTATVTGTPTYGATGPVSGKTAIDFGNVADYFSISDHADLDLGDFPLTVEFWYARDDDTGGNQVIIMGGTNAYAVNIEAGDRMQVGKIGVTGIVRTTQTIPADGTWHHYAWVRDAATLAGQKIYIDGVSVALDSISPTTALADNALTKEIGRESGQQSAGGKVAYVALYKSALSGTRVQAHYDAAAGAAAITVPFLDASPALYAPTLTPKNTLTVPFLDAAGALYAPTLATRNLITLALLDAGPALYAPTILPGPVGITLGLLDASPALYTPTLTASVTVALGLLDGAPALYAPTLTPKNLISLGLLDAGPALYAPTVMPDQFITLGLLDASAALYAPTLDSSATIALGLLDGAPALYAPTLATRNLITLALLDAGSALYAPTLVGKNTLTLGLLDSGSALYAPTLVGKNLISLGLLDAAAALYAPTLTQPAGGQTITLGLLDAAAALYAPSLVGKNALVIPLLTSTSALYAPSLATLNTISLGLLDAAAALYAPTVVQGAGVVTVTLVLLDSGRALYAPVLALTYEPVDPRIRRMMSNKNRGAWFNRR